MAKKPTAADAQLILHLYELRRESEMRKARSWWAGSFWPETADDHWEGWLTFRIPRETPGWGTGDQLLGHGGVVCPARGRPRGPFLR